MPCYHPVQGYRGRVANPVTGKRPVVFNPTQGFSDLPVTVPCGQCIGCRLERSRQWAVRIMHEASLYDENCFVTLTQDEAHIPVSGSLDKRAFPLFMRRLRKAFPERKVRYFHCGEYGAQMGRPHYHAILFGFDFVDKVRWTQRGDFQVFRSPTLERLWPSGFSEIGSVTFESAAYVARYIVDKVTGDAAEAHYSIVDLEGVIHEREPEFVTMSRRPGIGRPWLDKFMCEVYPEDGVVMRGVLMKPPRYYDKIFDAAEPDVFEGVRRERRLALRPEDQTPKRLADGEAVVRARLSLKGRRL